MSKTYEVQVKVVIPDELSPSIINELADIATAAVNEELTNKLVKHFAGRSMAWSIRERA
jgi:hypothetical protein